MADAAASVNFTLTDKIARLEDTVYTLSKVLEAQQITTGELGDIKPSIRSIRDRDIAELTRKWEEFSPPCMTFQQYLEYSNLFLRDQHERSLRRERDRNRAQYEMELNRRGPQIFQQDDQAGRPGPGYLFHEDFSNLPPAPTVNTETGGAFRPERFIAYDQDRAIATDLSTLIAFDRPLQYNRQVSLDLFSDQLIYFPSTTIFDLVKTFNNVLTRCEFLGFTKTMVADLLKKFTDKYFPSYSYVLRAETTSTGVFQRALGLIDSNEITSQIRTLFNNFKRTKDQTIKQVYFSFLTLTKIRLIVREPGLSEDAMRVKAQRIVTNQLAHFVSTDMAQLYNVWVADQHKNGQIIDPMEACRYISEMESRMENLAPVGDIHYSDNTESGVEALMNRIVTRSVAKVKNHKFLPGLTRSRKERSDKGKARSGRGRSYQQPRASTPDRSYREKSKSPPTSGRSSRASSTQSGGGRDSRSPSPAISYRSQRSDSGSESSRSESRERRMTGFHSRQSSQSRERNNRNFDRWSQKAKQYNKKLASLRSGCNKCRSPNHTSKYCKKYMFSKTKCEFCKDLFHKSSECKETHDKEKFYEKKN